MVPKSVLHAYTHSDPAKRRKLGTHAGKPTVIDAEVQQFAVDVICRRDRGNEGLSNRDAAELLHDLAPELKLEQVALCLKQTVRPRFSSVLTNIVKAQPSTTKRFSRSYSTRQLETS